MLVVTSNPLCPGTNLIKFHFECTSAREHIIVGSHPGLNLIDGRETNRHELLVGQYVEDRRFSDDLT